MEIEGMITQDLGSQEGVSKAGNPWKKHEWLLETLGQYPRKVKFTVFGEQRVNTITFVPGNKYVIQVDAESREFNGRWYTDLMAYSARPLEDDGMMPQAGPAAMPTAAPTGYAPQPQAPAPAPNPFDMPSQGDFSRGGAEEDLPF